MITNHNLITILGDLADVRGADALCRRIEGLLPRLKGRRFSMRRLKALFKANIHDHIDCSVRYDTMLEMWERLYEFDLGKVSFPEGTLAYWNAVGFDPAIAAFPASVVDLWRGTKLAPDLRGNARIAALKRSRAEAAEVYRDFLLDYGGGSLFQYVQAIVVHILPLMQTAANIERIIKERIEDGIKNGEGLAELRGAPQLHTWADLDLEAAVQAYLDGVRGAPYPIGITLCALRHEEPSLAWNVAKLAGKYRRQGVTCFDLAADEASNPGVLRWWVKPAVLAALFGLQLTIHLWETNEPTLEDIRCLNAFDTLVPMAREAISAAGLRVDQVVHSPEAELKISAIIDGAIDAVFSSAEQGSLAVYSSHLLSRVGHGFRGLLQGNRVCEICFSSNVATRQVSSLDIHPAHNLFHRNGALITINTDGTTLVGINGILDEYVSLQKSGWDVASFLIANLIAVSRSSMPKKLRMQLLHRCVNSYEQVAGSERRRR